MTTKDEHNLDKKTLEKIETIEEVMRVDEVSSEYNRLCCRPYHPFKLEFRQYVPLYGDSTMSSYDHLEQKETKQIKEYYNQWKFSSAAMQLGMKDLYNAQPVLFTMVCTPSRCEFCHYIDWTVEFLCISLCSYLTLFI